MELVYYRGLNCRLACIINIANALGVNYTEAYASLWSETDFIDETEYNIYVSKRIFSGLEAIGITTEALACDGMNMEDSLAQISDGEIFFVGMDTFYIPWHPVFKSSRGPHYFLAQKEASDSVLCFDPVYNKKDIRIDAAFPSAFEISRVHKTDAITQSIGVTQEAKAVLDCHPATRKRMLAEILKCGAEGRNNLILLLKQINAMINNRYLFRHFLHNSPLMLGRHEAFFNKTYFSKWEAVRNGLYKATVVKDSGSVINEVYTLFGSLMHEEINMAKELAATGSS